MHIMESHSTLTLYLPYNDILPLLAEKFEASKPPPLHEIWTWEGDTSVLPHKVTEILNSVAIFDENDPQFQSDDPFDFERPYKSDQIASLIKQGQNDGSF